MRDLVFQATTTAVLLGMGPIVVVVAGGDPLLVPLLALPLAAIYKGGRDAVVHEHRALHDNLTGLPNRALFRDRAAQAILAAERDGTCVAVMLMDLDRFKEVNDTLGHHHGDLLLNEVGPACRRPCATPTRSPASAATSSRSCSPTSPTPPPRATSPRR